MIANLPTPTTYTRVLLQSTPVKERARLLHLTNLNQEHLSSSDTIRADQQIQVLRNAQNIASRPDWALALGNQLNVNSHGALGFAALSAPTLGESLETLAAFARIRAPYLSFKFEQLQDRFYFTVVPEFELGELEIALNEIVLQIVDSLITVVLGSRGPGIKVMLSYPAPTYASDYARFFTAPCEFSQDFSGVELPSGLCRVPCPLHDEHSYVASLARCRQALAEVIDPTDTVSRVRNLISAYYEHLETGTNNSEAPTLESIAATLCMSPRTLIRRLATQGSGYREMLEKAQRDTACRLLGQARYSVYEIAMLLGYSDAANFGRAFRRWLGMAPGQYRRQ